MIAASAIERARAVPIEDEIDRRNIINLSISKCTIRRYI